MTWSSHLKLVTRPKISSCYVSKPWQKNSRYKYRNIPFYWWDSGSIYADATINRHNENVIVYIEKIRLYTVTNFFIYFYYYYYYYHHHHILLLLLLLLLLFYTGCPRRNGQNFGRVFLMWNYTNITQNTYIKILILRCGIPVVC